MSISSCELESAVADAVQTAHWTDELRAHAETCPVCSDVALVAGFLQQEAETGTDELLLPEPELIWWRAQLQERRDATRRATRPITLVQTISWMCGAATALAMLLWNAPSLGRAFFSSLVPTQVVSTTAAGMAQPWLVLTISAVAITFLALLDRNNDLRSPHRQP